MKKSSLLIGAMAAGLIAVGGASVLAENSSAWSEYCYGPRQSTVSESYGREYGCGGYYRSDRQDRGSDGYYCPGPVYRR